MSYESFDKTKNKIRKIWNESKDNENEAEIQQEKNNQIDKVIKFNETYSVKQIADYTTAWSNFEINEEGDKAKIEWKILIKKIPNKLIPFIRFQPVYKSSGQANSPKINHIIRLVLVRSSTVSDIEVVVGMQLDYLSGQVQGKLVINIINPENYS